MLVKKLTIPRIILYIKKKTYSKFKKTGSGRLLKKFIAFLLYHAQKENYFNKDSSMDANSNKTLSDLYGDIT